jgi:hypothetical protein
MKTKEYNFKNAKRGAVVKTPPNKTRITIRVDTDTLNWFRQQVHKAGGGNYQTLMNEALREYIQQRDTNLERILRRVIQEELQAGTTRTPARRIARSSRLQAQEV